MTSRRAFVVGFGIAMLAMPRAIGAQETRKVPLIGILTSNDRDEVPRFLEKLREVGYEDGRNIRLAIRSAGTEIERLSGLAAELVAMKVEIIVSINTPSTREAIKATKDIPIVSFSGDPIASGFVSSLSHPGGNVTGISALGAELSAKRLQLLKEAVPTVARVAALFNPDDPVNLPPIPVIERAAPQIGVEARFFAVRSQDSLIAAFKGLTDWRADAVFWIGGQMQAFIKPAINFAAEQRLPTMMFWPDQVRAGGLISYSPDPMELNRRVAILVDKIIKGAKPADLPVEQPTKFGLAINLKTAKALGITIPQSILARADEIIE